MVQELRTLGGPEGRGMIVETGALGAPVTLADARGGAEDGEDMVIEE